MIALQKAEGPGTLSQSLRENLRSLLLLTQALVEEHARVAKKWTSAVGQNQLSIPQLDQAIANEGIEKNRGVTSLLRQQVNFEPSHKSENLFTQLTILI